MPQPSSNRGTKWGAKLIATAAVCLALSFLLSYIRLWPMPTGGSVTAASMLPLMLFAWLYGVGPGLLAGTAYGLLQLIQKPEIVHWAQLLLDYPVAFAMLGLAGAFRHWKARLWALPAGVVLACLGRFACHFATGVLFFAEYAPAADLTAVVLYSAGYNGGYMGAEAALSALIALLPPVQTAIRRIEAL